MASLDAPVFPVVQMAAVAWGAALLLMLFALPSLAEDRFGESRDQDRAYRARHQGEVRSLDSLIGNARAKGKVLDVELKNKRYKVKILGPDGRVRTMDIDAGWGGSSHRGPGGGGDFDRSDSSGPGSGGRDDSSGSGGGGGRDDNEGSGSGGRGSGR